MSKRIWVALGVLLLLGILGGAGAVGAYFYVKAQRLEETFVAAEKFYDEGEWGQAKNRYGAYLWSRPDDIESLKKFAYASAQLLPNRDKNLGDAASAYYQITVRQPDNEEMMREVMDLQFRRRSWPDLEYYGGLFLQRWPDNEQLRYYRALALARMGREVDARDALQALLTEGTSIPEVYGIYADMEEKRSSYNQALRVFADGMQQSDNAGIQVEMAKYAARHRDFDTVEAVLEDLRANHPDTPGIDVVAANLAMARENYEDAIVFSLKAIEADPTDREAYLVAISAYDQNGQGDKAIELLDGVASEMKADNPEFYLALCELLISADRLAEAESTLSEYRKIYPSHGTMFDYIEARLLMARGNASQAATKLTSVVDAAPSFRQGRYYLAVALLESRKRDQARVAFQIYLSDNPQDEQAKQFYNREFGGGQGATRIDDDTLTRLQESGTTSPRALVAMAATIFNRRAVQGDTASAAETVKRLIEQAIQSDPTYEYSYRALIEVLLTLDDTEGAETALQRGLAAGVPAKSMRQCGAQIALAKGSDEEAHAIFAEAMNEDALTVNDIVRWAEVFALRGGVDEAIRLLSNAAGKREAEDANTLELEKVSVAARFGEIDRAIELMRELEARPDAPQDLKDGLTNQKIDLVRQVMVPGPSRDLALARKLTEELIAHDPGNSRNQLLKAEVLWNQEPPDYAGAQEVAEGLLASHPNDSDVMLTVATLASRKGDYLQALDYAERAINTSPNSLEPYAFEAETYMRMRNFLKARNTLERALEMHPDSPRLLEMYVEANRVTGRLTEAETAFSRLERVSDDTPEATQRLGLVRAKLMLDSNKEPEIVESLLRSQLDEHPDDVRTALDLARLLAGSDRAVEAEGMMESFAKANESQPEAWVGLARFYLSMDTPEMTTKASSALTRAMILQRDYDPALLTMIEVNMRLNNFADALLYCNRYLEKQPDDDAVLFQKARLLSQEGIDLEEAQRSLDRALAVQPKTEYSLLRGLIRVGLKNYQGGVDDLEQALKTMGDRAPEVNLALAEAYAALGRLEQAKRYWSAAQRQINNGATLNPRAVERVEALIAKAEAEA